MVPKERYKILARWSRHTVYVQLHMNHHTCHQHIILQRFNMLTVYRFTNVAFLKTSPQIMYNQILHDNFKTHVPLQYRGSAAIKMVLVSLEEVEYFIHSLNDLVNCCMVLSPGY